MAYQIAAVAVLIVAGLTMPRASGLSRAQREEPAEACRRGAAEAAAAWANGTQEPAWQVLRKQLRAELGDRAFKSSTATVSSTVAYLLSQYPDEVAAPAMAEGEFRVHLIGSTYVFEGMQDWSWLARSLPSSIRRVQIDLILGSPYASDGPSYDETGSLLDVEGLEDELGGQKHWPKAWAAGPPSFLQIQSMGDEPLSQSYLRHRACRTQRFCNGVEVSVMCNEDIYQNVWGKLKRPHLALMVNPGFPLPYRRSYDSVLHYLLNQKIPTAVSAQMAGIAQSREQPELERHDLLGGKPAKVPAEWSSEEYQTLRTLEIFDANLLGVTVSPFPFMYVDSEDEPEESLWFKNDVIEFFVGRKPGVDSAVALAPALREGKKLRRTSGGDDQELLSSLRTQVSTMYQKATEEWCRSSGMPCEGFTTVNQWLKRCADDNC